MLLFQGVSLALVLRHAVLFCFSLPQDAEHTPHGGKSTEWLFVSPPDGEKHGWRDRFGHVGDTIIPGAGTAWQHMHRASVRGPDSPHSGAQGGDGDDSAEVGGDEEDVGVASGSEQDDLDELPFQVCFVVLRTCTTVRTYVRTLFQGPTMYVCMSVCWVFRNKRTIHSFMNWLHTLCAAVR